MLFFTDRYKGMSDFLARFKEDPEFGDSRWMWMTKKPVLVNAIAEFALFDEEFHTYKLGKAQPYPLEPSCASCRVADDQVAVFTFEQDASNSKAQENAWEYLVENASTIEVALRRKLVSIQANCIVQMEEELADGAPYQDHWDMIQRAIPNPATEIDRFYKLVGITLATTGLDECGFVGFEFQTAWDKDHGLEILMHKDRVIAMGGMTELMVTDGSMIERIKAVQQYEPDPTYFQLSYATNKRKAKQTSRS
jgi:hypothetical protein